jgi:hypothetical protein
MKANRQQTKGKQTMKYQVINRDVDGKNVRTFKKLSSAAAYFQEMCGLTIEQALSEKYFMDGPVPTFDQVEGVGAVGSFGNKVSIRKIVSEFGSDGNLEKLVSDPIYLMETQGV